MKDIFALLGVDGVVGLTIYAIDPSFLKVILGIGIASLVGLLVLSKGQGRVSIYGCNLVMTLVALMHYN